VAGNEEMENVYRGRVYAKSNTKARIWFTNSAEITNEREAQMFDDIDIDDKVYVIPEPASSISAAPSEVDTVTAENLVAGYPTIFKLSDIAMREARSAMIVAAVKHLREHVLTADNHATIKGVSTDTACKFTDESSIQLYAMDAVTKAEGDLDEKARASVGTRKKNAEIALWAVGKLPAPVTGNGVQEPQIMQETLRLSNQLQALSAQVEKLIQQGGVAQKAQPTSPAPSPASRGVLLDNNRNGQCAWETAGAMLQLNRDPDPKHIRYNANTLMVIKENVVSNLMEWNDNLATTLDEKAVVNQQVSVLSETMDEYVSNMLAGTGRDEWVRFRAERYHSSCSDHQRTEHNQKINRGSTASQCV
jgi:hypothetical protein